MGNQEILQKAIEKALANGWEEKNTLSNGWGYFNDGDRGPTVDKEGVIWQYDGDDNWCEVAANSIIFNHDFAKALWGEEPAIRKGEVMSICGPLWQYHLTQMVIAEDPIAYLGANLPK